jgi:hypothetical protein
MEQVWAYAKRWAGICRYMAGPNRHDFLDDAFGYVAEIKAAGFPRLLADIPARSSVSCCWRHQLLRLP